MNTQGGTRSGPETAQCAPIPEESLKGAFRAMGEKLKVVLTPGPDKKESGSGEKRPGEKRRRPDEQQARPEPGEAGRVTWKDRMDKGEEIPWYIRRRFEKEAKKTDA